MQLQQKHTKKAKKRKIHNQLPLFTSTPPHLYIQTKSCSLKKEKVCRLFPFSSSLEDRRARILKKKNGKMSSSDCQIRTDNVFFFFKHTYSSMLTLLCPPPPFLMFKQTKHRQKKRKIIFQLF
jgi:hypothetical protein